MSKRFWSILARRAFHQERPVMNKLSMHIRDVRQQINELKSVHSGLIKRHPSETTQIDLDSVVMTTEDLLIDLERYVDRLVEIERLQDNSIDDNSN